MESRKQLRVWIELTENCQLSCRFCYNFWANKSASQMSSMSNETLEKVVLFFGTLAADYDLLYILAGGDPSAHSELVPIVECLSQHGSVHVVTHGTDLSFDALDSLAKIPGEIALQFSIPTPNPERYNYLTGGSDVTLALERLLYAKAIGLSISISAVITKLNLIDIPDLIQLSLETEINYIVLNRFMPTGRGMTYSEPLSLPKDSFSRSVENAKKTQHEDLQIISGAPRIGIRKLKVDSPQITVSVNGELRVCSLSNWALGDLDSDPFEALRAYSEFWESTETLTDCECSNSKYCEPLSDNHTKKTTSPMPVSS